MKVHWLQRYKDPVKALAVRAAGRKRYYAANKDKINSEAVAWAKANPLRRKEIMAKHDASRKTRVNAKHLARKLAAIEYKGGVCLDCRNSYPPAAMEFHHPEPRKGQPAPSQFLAWSLDRAKAEIDKCVLLCANCHRIRHFPALSPILTQPST